MKTLLIIDIESYIYKASVICNKIREIEPLVYQEVYDLNDAIDYIETQLKRLVVKLGGTDIILALGDRENNFRKKIYPQYKGNRTKSKPLMYDMVYDYVISKHNYVQLPNLEADDVCRIVYEDNNEFKYDKKIIVSIDKDFFTVPCKFFRVLPNDNTKEVMTISPAEAEFNLMKQTITGDTADNYKGIPLWGEVKAMKWLEEKKRTWAEVLDLFKENGMTSDDYVINKTMATLVGLKQYDFEKGEVIYGK